MKTNKSANDANGNNRGPRVEFLYFNECPAHKQALSNLKAAPARERDTSRPHPDQRPIAGASGKSRLSGLALHSSERQ
jgi:hypothetical protein